MMFPRMVRKKWHINVSKIAEPTKRITFTETSARSRTEHYHDLPDRVTVELRPSTVKGQAALELANDGIYCNNRHYTLGRSFLVERSADQTAAGGWKLVDQLHGPVSASDFKDRFGIWTIPTVHFGRPTVRAKDVQSASDRYAEQWTGFSPWNSEWSGFDMYRVNAEPKGIQIEQTPQGSKAVLQEGLAYDSFYRQSN